MTLAVMTMATVCAQAQSDVEAYFTTIVIIDYHGSSIMLADVVLNSNATLTAIETGMDKNLQGIGVVGKDVETTTAHNDA